MALKPLSVDQINTFDPDAYLMANPDVAAAGADPIQHWLEHGRVEESKQLRKNWRSPHFDESAYLNTYPDVKIAVEQGYYASGAEHWYMAGRIEVFNCQRNPIPDFDERTYLMIRPELLLLIKNGKYLDPLDHYLCLGRYEERSAFHKPHLPSPPTNLRGMLTKEKQDFWHKNGFIILENVIPEKLCDAMNERIGQAWVERKTSKLPISIDAFIETPESCRIMLRDAPGEARSIPYKINDMVILDETARQIALHEDVCDALRWVLEADPVAISSLNFERGSTQRFHTDTLYMPGLEEGGMTAAWFALEDVNSAAGPLLYYPGSHKIPLFKFSDGRSYQINDEVPNYTQYKNEWISQLQLQPSEFLPKKGDVLIWHERLYHAGKAIEDIAQTRKSLVVHYWRNTALPASQITRSNGGFYLNRPPILNN